MRNVAKLRGSRIYIYEDLCPASQEIKRAQLPLLKQAKSEGKVAYFRHTKLIIKDKNIYANIIDMASTSRGNRNTSEAGLLTSRMVALFPLLLSLPALGRIRLVALLVSPSGGSAALAGAQDPLGSVEPASGPSGLAVTAGPDGDSSARGACSSGTLPTASPMLSQGQDTTGKTNLRPTEGALKPC
ncbi:hypothetical protein GWK47_022104 [Chionoecetes opilio]|uniref:Uncharacterized protein n=1 Tax=Chionoecetes opilio TaxID=41210 RepID=A0A8J5BV55_CHIOP|nr:hypothetical protein GWK47_022104 [Chionoecetes opilio]